MAYQEIDIGAVANDGTGDALRDAFKKVQQNFAELYSSIFFNAGGLAQLTAWLTGTAYKINQIVVQSGSLYRCLIDHGSGVFATDLAAGKWLFLVALPLSDQGVAGPDSAVVNNIPVFSNTDGKHIEDSGVPISAIGQFTDDQIALKAQVFN